MGLLTLLRPLFSPPPEERRRLLLDPALLDEPQHAPPELPPQEEHCPHGAEDAAPCDDPSDCCDV